MHFSVDFEILDEKNIFQNDDLLVTKHPTFQTITTGIAKRVFSLIDSFKRGTLFKDLEMTHGSNQLAELSDYLFTIK